MIIAIVYLAVMAFAATVLAMLTSAPLAFWPVLLVFWLMSMYLGTALNEVRHNRRANESLSLLDDARSTRERRYPEQTAPAPAPKRNPYEDPNLTQD